IDCIARATHTGAVHGVFITGWTNACLLLRGERIRAYSPSGKTTIDDCAANANCLWDGAPELFEHDGRPWRAIPRIAYAAFNNDVRARFAKSVGRRPRKVGSRQRSSVAVVQRGCVHSLHFFARA